MTKIFYTTTFIPVLDKQHQLGLLVSAQWIIVKCREELLCTLANDSL